MKELQDTKIEIINKIRDAVFDVCRSSSNTYGMSAWTHHISIVVDVVKKLGQKMNADIEVLVISAYLHDYANILNEDNYKEHHIHSASLAETLLKNLNYPDEKIEQVKHCILTHRSSIEIKRNTLEAKILASADAMAHFYKPHSLLHLAYTKYNMGVDEGSKWVLDKLERSWKKLLPEAKELILTKYNAIKKTLN